MTVEEQMEDFITKFCKLADEAGVAYFLFAGKEDGEAFSAKIGQNTKPLGLVAEKQSTFALQLENETKKAVGQLAAAALLLKMNGGKCTCGKCNIAADKAKAASEQVLH